MKNEIIEESELDSLDGNLIHYASHSSVVWKSASKNKVRAEFNIASKCINRVCLKDFFDS